MTKSELHIAKLNSNFFFKEFTFSSNKFKIDESGKELELADNVIWLDDLLIISQIKERNNSEKLNTENWFKNKVLGKAVKQIKNTIKYFEIYKNISIPNDRGHILNVSEARKLDAIKLIIYAPDEEFPEILRFQKYYKSNEVGLINLFHIEDYLWICKYLITPFEIREYLHFRKLLFLNHENLLNNFPEQYVLSHYIQSLDVTIINPNYINGLSNFIKDTIDFDIAFIIQNFQDKIQFDTGSSDYYKIIAELAKLNRADLREFKKRFLYAIDKSKDDRFNLPYRFTSLNSKCGFVFAPIEYKFKDRWQKTITAFTEAHKYDQILDKCVGMIVFYSSKDHYYDINWCYIESKWKYNSKLESLFKSNFPFRHVKIEKSYRYYFNENKNI